MVFIAILKNTDKKAAGIELSLQLPNTHAVDMERRRIRSTLCGMANRVQRCTAYRSFKRRTKPQSSDADSDHLSAFLSLIIGIIADQAFHVKRKNEGTAGCAHKARLAGSSVCRARR